MSPDSPSVRLSTLDEDRFGIRTARASHVTFDMVPAVIQFCQDNAVTLLIVRCPTSDLRAAQALERTGALLMDTLVYFKRGLLDTVLPSDVTAASIRPMQLGETAAIGAIAAEVFQGYFGHYHADERLDPRKCDDAYVSWAVRSCESRDVAEEVLVAESDGALVGFFTLRLNNPEEGEAVVGGVIPAAQGRGIYRSFIISGMQWSRACGARQMVVSTQITNLAVQKVWSRLGFEPSHAFYTFHLWFDRTSL